MRRFLLLLAPLLCAGCAGRYLAHRGRDALDVLTCQVGIGLGAKLRAGPVVVGALSDLPLVGLKGGTASPWYPANGRLWDLQAPALGLESFAPGDALERSKAYEAWPVLPFVQRPRSLYAGGSLPYHTQLELTFGLGASLRVGINPGELVDFLLGWAGLDLYGDDVETIPPPRL